MAKVTIPSFTLNNGVKMPALGYGTWLGLDSKMEFDYSGWDKMIECLSYCIDVGYRHIDTAHLYRVEPAIGEVIRQKVAAGVVAREELFVTTKVWQHFHREADVEVSVRGSLRRLGLEYLDQVLVHWPMSWDQDGVDEKIDFLETWRGFESVLRKGLVRSIGVSNFNVEQLKRLIANCDVKPVTNQVELNLTLGQKELVDYCKSQNILIVAWAPFGSMIASRARPEAPEPKMDNPTLVAIAKKYGKTVVQVTLRYLLNLTLGQKELVDYCKSQNILIVAWAPFGSMIASRARPEAPEPKMDNPTLVAIAKKYGKTVVQVTLRYLYQRGIITIPKTVTPSRVLENASIFDFELTASEFDTISKFDVNYRTDRASFFQNYANFPFEKYGDAAGPVPESLLRWKNGKNQDID